jgi:hypothetical protein
MATRIYAPRSSTLEERLAFRSEPRVPGRCQLWLGGSDSHGYGQLRWNGRVSRVARLTWESERGPIPPGMHVLHRCDNPPCRNIDHLFLGTNDDNIADKIAKGRQARTPGESHVSAKLTEAQVLEIRAFPAGASPKDIGALYGVSKSTICKIRSRKRWTHL